MTPEEASRAMRKDREFLFTKRCPTFRLIIPGINLQNGTGKRAETTESSHGIQLVDRMIVYEDD